MIAAVAENNALGKNNELVWHYQMILKDSNRLLRIITLLWAEKLLKVFQNLYQIESIL